MKRNNLRAVKEPSPRDPITSPMLTLDQSKEILNRNGIAYTDEEISIIREFMHRVTEITTAYYQRLKDKKAQIPTITPIENHDQTESIPLHSRKYGRTG
jgi:hypothetical protein